MDAFINLRTKLAGQFTKCCICNKSKEMERIEMHHVRHVRKVGFKYKGFAELMGVINRKQIPVCKSCHRKIHNGEYDGEDLGKLASRIKGNLGIIGKRKPQ